MHFKTESEIADEIIEIHDKSVWWKDQPIEEKFKSIDYWCNVLIKASHSEMNQRFDALLDALRGSESPSLNAKAFKQAVDAIKHGRLQEKQEEIKGL